MTLPVRRCTRQAPRSAFDHLVFASLALATLAIALPAAAKGDARELDDLRISYEKFVLDNGLRLIVHRDPKAPIAAVNVWYHVGSKNERRGKTGFAHLFEHLMFEGSEHYNAEFTLPFDRVGATDQNATTNSDRTNYFETVPINALDLALWMESDRMGHLLGAISQERLDEQRGVVKNEKRQNENEPYGAVYRLIGKNAYPDGHPYRWPTIGSMKDLDAASLDDVRKWFERFYGAANAVLTIAGDVDPQAVRERVEHYFGGVAPGPPVGQRERWVAERNEASRLRTYDRVPQSRIIKVWNIPETGHRETDLLDMASSILAEGKSSRLYKRLVYEDQIATDVSAFTWERQLGSLLVVWATVAPGADPVAVERALDQELERLVSKGPTRKEVERTKTQFRASFLRGIESVGGYGGKADILAQSEVYFGSPDAYLHSFETIAGARAKDIRGALKRWIHDGVFVLEVHPASQAKAGEDEADRAHLPVVGPAPQVVFPSVERDTLESGLDIIVVPRHSVPTVSFQLLVDAGYSSDPSDGAGTAKLALDMLPQGTRTRSALEIDDALADLGAELSTRSNLDLSIVELSALRSDLDPALELFADVILNPAFAPDEFERRRAMQLAAIEQESVTPFRIALRVFPGLLFGRNHAYGLPFTGSGTRKSVEALTRNDLVAFHARWFAPSASTLVVVGDTTRQEIVPKLEKLFRKWKARKAASKDIVEVVPQAKSRVFLIDRPGAIQSMVFAGHLGPPKATPREPAIEVMNEVLGAGFNSRINRNLREDKHWSYGAHSAFVSARGQRPFFVYGAVQTDKTTDSMLEIVKELREIQGARPPSADEIERAKNVQTLSLPGRWETGAAVASSIAEIVRFGFDDDYWNHYAAAIEAVDGGAAAEAATFALRPDALTWIVIGDRAQIEAPIRALELGPIQFIDADGESVD
ncbi:MAG: pitrilysin family protein [Myxococcota bacterium]|nr:pitrilysin family protein [Myxococcota bacterium]